MALYTDDQIKRDMQNKLMIEPDNEVAAAILRLIADNATMRERLANPNIVDVLGGPPNPHNLTQEEAPWGELLEGKKYDQGKSRMDLLPFDALLGVGDVLAYGAKKYADRNWEKGMSWGRLVAATLRHIGSWVSGHDVDSESGLHHLSHASCCILMLYALVIRKIGTDDRKVL